MKILETILDKLLSAVSARSLEKYKNELLKITEQAKFEYQKQLADFNQYVVKKHNIYPELFRLLQVAQFRIKDFKAPMQPINYSTFTIQDLKAILDVKGLPNLFNEGILLEWEKIKNDGVEKIKFFVERVELMAARNSLQEFKNYFWLNVIYLSPLVEKKMEEFIKKIEELLVIYEIPDIPSSDHGKIRKLIDETDSMSGNELKTILRKELV